MSALKDKFSRIIQSQEWLMSALRDVRSLNLPDSYIAAGALRNTVWNVLHGFKGDTNQNDIDIVYFDRLDIKEKRAREAEGILRSKNPSLNWEVVNQVDGSIYSPERPTAYNSESSIAYWSETPTCIGARLEKDNSITICAPHGLDDLFNLIVRPIPKPKQDLELYAMRIKEKKWKKTWPKLKIIRV